MTEYRRQLETIEKTINDKKIEKARLEERLKSLEAERKNLEKELDTLVPAGEDVEEWLKREEAEIKKGIEECQSILSGH